jgi:hypothetical protein
MIQEVTWRTVGGFPAGRAAWPRPWRNWCRVALDCEFAAGIAQVLDLAEQLGGVAFAFVPALVQVPGIGVDQVGALLGLGDQVIGAAGGGELAHGGRVQSELAADRGLGQPLAVQVLDRLVVVAHPGDDLLFCRRLHHRRRGLAGRRGRRFAEVGAAGIDRLLYRLAEVLPQVEAVGDLHRLRRARPGTFAITTGAVPADHGDLAVAAQPPGQVRAVPAVEDLDRAVGGHIDQHRAVMAAFAEREVVDAEHRHQPGRRVGQRLDQPQQRVPAHRHPRRGGQPHACAPGQRQPDLRQQAP